MEKRLLNPIYTGLILIFSYKNCVAYMREGIPVSWQDLMYLLFNSVEPARAKDNMNIFIAFFLLSVFIVIENAYIDFFWKQTAMGIYKIRLGSKFKVWGIKYVFSLLTAIKYYLSTVLVCVIFGRGSSSINQYSTIQIIVQPLIF